MLPIKPSHSVIDALDRHLTTMGEKGSDFYSTWCSDPRVP